MNRPKPIKAIKKIVKSRRPSISEVVREPTAGGVVWRRNSRGGLEILLIQDAKDRWTIPKGHIEEGETAKETAEREIQEETGLQHMTMQNWLGKINFQYRRQQSLVLMTTDIFLVAAKGDTDALKPEEWMRNIKWFSASEAVDSIAYEDIAKIILLGMKKIREDKL